MASSGFINLSNGSGGCGFAAAPVGLHSCEWAGDPVQLAGQTTVWQCEGGPSDDNPPPPVCVSTDGGGGGAGRPPPPSGEQQGVPEIAACNMLGARKGKDRAKTIVLERKRRIRMTETLYHLRSLVPNITKMDKASIIGDAVEYVKSLQSHARKLKEEVGALEAQRSSSPGPQRDHRAGEPAADEHQDAGSGARGVARVVGAARVGEGRFLVTAECEQRDGAAARLCAAVESLASSCFLVESSSLVGRAAPADRLVSTATLKATCQVEAATIGEGTVKLLLIAALSEEGFRIDGEATAAGIS